MSILVVQLVPPGLIFAADRNITVQTELGDGKTVISVEGQSQRPKVLKWPNRELIIGYVGEGMIEGHPTDQWLYGFIGRQIDPTLPLSEIADCLRTELDSLFTAGDFRQPLIVHLGGFELVGDVWTPSVFFLRNTASILPNGAYVLGTDVECTEELSRPPYFPGQDGNQIRGYVSEKLFSFRQGYDLGAFNVIDEGLREATRAILHSHPGKPLSMPCSLDDWAKHVAFAVHGYGAYFAAFFEPFAQYVGGGADVVTAIWPP